ncbi:MAG: glycosyltransferase family 2 protein [Bacteroidales bacterium]|nr:glycosyltransferase family 2 protein [Bacteroidales bacterium]
MKISLLVPVYDYDIIALVHGMKSGLGKVPEFIEILIGDDGSSAEFKEKYRAIEGEGVRLISSEKNIGRAAIRNKLAMEASGDYLLFIDADTVLQGTSETYFRNWLSMMSVYKVICGGVLYHDAPPGDPDKLLRWTYGKWYEQRKASEKNKNPHEWFTTFNVMIEKSVFSKIRFNEGLKQYGYEDTLMGYQLKKAGIDVLHIDNGLVHEGLETNKEFLNKTKLGIENLSRLYDNVTDKRTFSRNVKVLRTYNSLRFFRLTGLLARILYQVQGQDGDQARFRQYFTSAVQVL